MYKAPEKYLKKKIYISGPMSGLDWDKEVVPKFEKATNKLKKDYIVINPARNSETVSEDLTWVDWMKLAITEVEICDEIYMLNGWEKSTGAKEELIYAIKSGKKVIFEDGDWIKCLVNE